MSDEARLLSQKFLDSIQPAVLVGGKSRRFGRDKLAEPWCGSLLVQHPVNALRRVFGARVRLVGECDPLILPLADGQIPDGYPGVGPIGGITAALEFWDGPVFVLAGDMPDVAPSEILKIVAAAERGERFAAVLAYTERLHPCFGLYRTACQATLKNLIQTGKFRLADAVPREHILAVTVNRESASNINTEKDAHAR